MGESPTQSSSNTIQSRASSCQIPVEIISQEEMALIEAAFIAARSFFSSVSSSSSSPPPPILFRGNSRSISSVTVLSKRKLSLPDEEGHAVGDIEDAVGGGGNMVVSDSQKSRIASSLLLRFRRKRGLAVTDITSTEWCEKQVEFTLQFHKPKPTKAMKLGSARHAALEEEVIKRVQVHVKSNEDIWALKFMNFIIGTNQLLSDGLTRELPLVGFVEDVWMVGVIDEIQLPPTEANGYAKLIDTKTRKEATLPSEPQFRNGRLQLMCYKHLWDNLVADKFPTGKFLESFSLNPHSILSEEVREHIAKSGVCAETLDELMRCHQHTCSMLPPANKQLLLRYELQGDQSLIGEIQFEYDSDWLKGQVKCCLEFWHGEQEARYVPKEERWKCRFCEFASVCPNGSKAKS